MNSSGTQVHKLLLRDYTLFNLFDLVTSTKSIQHQLFGYKLEAML